MKKTLLIAAAIITQLSSFATNFSGIISANTTWTKANSPYIITGQVLVDTNVLLTIEPGVEVHMTGNYEFFVDGSLNASGSATDSIVFTTNSQTSWKGIVCRKKTGNDSCIIRYCRVENIFAQGNSSAPGINNDNARLVIENSKFYKADILSLGQVSIKNNFFINSALLLTYLRGNNEVSDNTISYGEGLGFHLYDLLGPVTLSVKNNKIHHCQTGMFINNDGILYDPRTVIVEDNILIENGLGLYCSNGKDQLIRNNTIAYNETGIHIVAAGTLFSKNNIKHNKTAIFIQWCDTNTHFTHNCIDSNSEFNVVLSDVHSQNSTVHLQNNYWGTTDSAAVRSKTYDFYRDFNLSQVYYMPVAQSCMTGTTGIIQPMEQQQQPEFYPNPFSTSFNIQAPGIIKEVTVYNIVGTKLVSAQPKAATALVDMANMPGGIYIYRMELADGRQYTGKLKKE